MLAGAKGRQWKLTAREIDGLTMGQLANAYGAIQTQTHADAVVHQVLNAVNPERVLATHHRRGAVAERRLRLNVGQHMWKLYAAMKAVLGPEVMKEVERCGACPTTD